MIHLTTLEKYEVGGRLAHAVELPSDFNKDPHLLRGSRITLDGEEVRVNAIEAPCVMWPNKALLKIGLIVS